VGTGALGGGPSRGDVVAVEVRDPQWFGGVVRAALGLRGYSTQAALASAAGLSLNSVANVITGARPSYRLATIEALASGLGVPASRLVRCATGSPGRRAPADAAAELLDAGPDRGQAAFLVTIEGLDASVVEAALGAALASLASTRPGAHVSLRPA
jgi:transcriptional regulator with XRE-family HTH domain